MFKWKKQKLNLKPENDTDKEYEEYINNLIQNEYVLSMKKYIQHSNINCFDHCLYVSYISYKVCKKLGFDYHSVIRGGLLHDFFLYDWHIPKGHKGLHGFNHPNIALENANKHFQLNKIEKDIIYNHMWPLTIRLPKYKETFVVALVDKYCSCIEILRFKSKIKLPNIKNFKEVV